MELGSDRASPGAAAELEALISSAGGEMVAITGQHRRTADPATLVGRGKAEEIRALAAAHSVDMVVFDRNLSPAQVSRLEEATGCKVIDRTELIMAIFARQARTSEARLQIELAMLKYALPRLSGMWHHFSRLGGGIGTRGPGETQLEVDRRRARRRIRLLEDELEKISNRRELRDRRRGGSFRVALTGYTNTGKSTLLNRMCGSSVHSEDRLFATLDSTTRRIDAGRSSGGMVLSDTVGFVERLPEHLVASFRSTLSVVREADLLLVVGDASSPWRDIQLESVRETLERIGAGGIERITVWNKIDLVPPGGRPAGGICVSALTGEGVGDLEVLVRDRRDSSLDWFDLVLADPDERLVNWLYENCVVREAVRSENGASFRAGSRGGAGGIIRRLQDLDPGSWSVAPLYDAEARAEDNSGGPPGGRGN